MSLTSFVSRPDVKAKLQPLRPKLPRKLSAPLKVALRSKRYMLVGTAFDYLLRFELQGNSFLLTQVCKPLPGEDTFDPNDRVIAIRRDHPQKRVGRGGRFVWTRVVPC